MEYTVEFFQKSADYVMSIIKDKPEIAIILGSGLGDFVSKIKNPIEIKYDDIPNFLVSTVASHAGKLISSFGAVRRQIPHVIGVPLGLVISQCHAMSPQQCPSWWSGWAVWSSSSSVMLPPVR